MIALFVPRRWLDQWGGPVQALMLAIALTCLVIVLITGLVNGVAVLGLWAFVEFIAISAADDA